jgi:UDP:flavonoid glycosyltransferase YjiC (YdhE family)
MTTMRVVITTVGSRGDVQPYVALGCGLARRGHEVTLATHAPFEGLARAHGLGFFPLSVDPQALISSEQGLNFLDSAANPVLFIQRYMQVGQPMVEDMCHELRAAVAPAEAVVFSPLSLPAADFAEANGRPAVLASPVPLAPTGAFPFMVMPGGWDFGPIGNRLTHDAAILAFSLAMAGTQNRWRAKVGLAPLPAGPLAWRPGKRYLMQGISPHVLPRAPEWGADVAHTGYWFLDEPDGWQPPADLAAFLAAGEAPVYVGFGSMADREPRKLAATVFDALALAGRRGVVLSGWAGLGRADVPDHVHMVEDVPHSWLFPRMAAVVHHGGAGTTAAGLRAGVPSVVTPVFGDQPFWGHRVHALGVGPPPLPRPRLKTWELAGAIRLAVSDPGMRERAARLGEALRKEDGVAAACACFERWTT